MYTKKLLLIVCGILISNLLFAQTYYADWKLGTLEYSVKEDPSYMNIPEACHEIALRYYEGIRGGEKDINKAIYWFKESANRGHVLGQYNLGTIYHGGYGVDANINEAIYWYEKASTQFYHKASMVLGEIYYHGSGVNVDYVKAARMLKDAAFGGEAKGMSLYAQCYARGRGVKTDSTKALLWAKRAIDLGYANAYWVIGKMYENGESVKKNYYLAKYYYEKGDEANDALSQSCLGVMYYNGLIGEPDYQKAIEYITKAGNNGDITAMENLIALYDDKDSKFYNINEAIKWYKKLVEAGQDFFFELAWTYEEAGQFQNAKKVYEKIIDNGDIEGYNDLAYLYAKGGLGVKDFDKAIDCINIAIKANPNHLEYYDSKGEIYLMKGDVKKAKKNWEYINKTNPNFYSEYIEKFKIIPPLHEYMINLK